MKKYTTTGVITLQDGVVSLSENQALIRKVSLEKVKKGVYQIIAPIQLKAGEEIGFEKTPKAFMGSLISQADAKAKADEEAKAKADAEKDAKAKADEEAKAKADA